MLARRRTGQYGVPIRQHSNSPAGSPLDPPAGIRRRATLAASTGNFVEWYDFGVFGFLAPVIAVVFFPSDHRGTALLATFAVFGVAFLARPLGGLFFGRLGDRIGRRPTLSGVVLLMSASTFAIGLLPSAASVGAAAPVLLIVARVIQGFAAGGELTGAITYVVEFAPRDRRGVYGSWVLLTQGLGGIAAALTVVALTAGLGDEAMRGWGWRIPFLLALPLGVIGLYLRWRTRETPGFAAVQASRAVERTPLRTTMKTHRRALLQVMGLVLAATMVTQTLTAFVPVFLQRYAGLTAPEALRASLAGLVVFVVLCPVFGVLADRVGRRPLALATPAATTVLGLPALLLLATGQPSSAVAGCALLGLILAPFGGAAPAILAELFPTSLRYSGLSIGSAVAISIFGGFTPLLLTWLVERTGSAVAPGLVLAGVGLVSLLTASTLTGTAALTPR